MFAETKSSVQKMLMASKVLLFFYSILTPMASPAFTVPPREAIYVRPAPGDSSKKQYYLFSYFLNEAGGMRYAISTDGYRWDTIGNGHPFLVPLIDDKLLRDPSICLGPDKRYHLVWTSAWKGNSFGYASSPDLIHWSSQERLDLMKDIPHTVNCWAPEIFYDADSSRYIVYWSSTISASGIYSRGKNYLFYSTTRDFINFSSPRILFTNGYSGGGQAGKKGVIDGCIYRPGKRYLLFYKKDDNTGVANLFFRSAVRPTGSWGPEHGPLLPSTGDEGPSCIRIGEEYLLFTDPKDSENAFVFVTRDFKSWKRKKTNLRMSHGSVMAISKETALALTSGR